MRIGKGQILPYRGKCSGNRINQRRDLGLDALNKGIKELCPGFKKIQTTYVLKY